MSESKAKDMPMVLVVDDEPANALLLKRTIEPLNCEVHVAVNGWEAIEKSKQNVYALILLDIIMPELNGYETIVRIKSLTLNKETPVFFITGMETDQEMLVNVYKAGAVDFIQKPININILKRKTKYFVDFFNQKEELKAAKIRSENLVKSRMSLIANITHELRTPLFAMMGMVEVLGNNKVTDEQKVLVDKLKINSEHLLDTVNDFLDFSKMEMSEAIIENEYFSISKMCEDIIDVMSYQHHKSEKVDLKFSFDHSIPEFVRADKGKIRHILLNLISNALKFTDVGSVKLEVRDIGMKLGNRLMKFVVKDTGLGIPKDKLDSIFEEYTQVHNEKQNEVQGTGLGLTICKKLVDVLGGHLTVKSKEGQGSTFSFTIPYQLGESGVVREAKNTHSLHDLLGDRNIKVLIADDVHDNIFVIKSYLNTSKINLDHTVSSNEALHKLRHNKYDLILLDINMPGLSGFEVCKQYRKFEKEENLDRQNIIALTAFSLSEELEDQLGESGFDNYLMKPVKKESLYEMVVSYAHDLKKEGFTKIAAVKENQVEPDLYIDDLDEDFRSYLPTYLGNKIKEVNQLYDCISEKDRNGAAALCHKILGTARSFGFFKLDRDVERIHKLTKEDFDNFYPEIEKLGGEVKEYLNRLKEELVS